MRNRSVGARLVLLVAGLVGSATVPASAAVTYVQESREIHANVQAPPPQMSDTRAPAGFLADFTDSVVVQSDVAECELQGGGTSTFQALALAEQDSIIQPLSISVFGRASGNYPNNFPNQCGPGTSVGSSRSVFSVVFTTDVDYRFVLSAATFREAFLALYRDAGNGPELLYSASGVDQIDFDQILNPGTFTFDVSAHADENDPLSGPFDVDLTLTETAPLPGAGRVPLLLLEKTPVGDLQLDWQASCSTDDDDYAVFEGDLGLFTSHEQELCTTGGTTSAVLPQPSGNHYYLVVPLDGTDEGSYGTDSSAVERPVGVVACGAQNIASSCP